MVGNNEASINTAFKCFSFEIILTEDGILHYKEVIALFFEFKRKIEEEWLAESEVLDVWQEEKILSNFKYDIYTARPANEHVCEIAEAMIMYKNIS